MSLKKLRKNQNSTPPDLSKVQESLELSVDPAYDGWRIDKFLSSLMNWTSRNRIQKQIQNGEILKNGIKVVPGRKIRHGDVIYIKIPPPDENDLKILEAGEIETVFEDEFILVVNKPPNLLVHPVGGRRYSSVINILHKKFRNFDEPEKDIIPILAHRIDIETSGALLVVKDKNVRTEFVQLFENREIKKKYLSICEGHLPLNEIFVDIPIGRAHDHEMGLARAINFTEGQDSQTIFKVVQKLNGFDVVECELLTGRQHQIRIHIEALGHPLLCDPYYGKRRRLVKSEIEKIKNDKKEQTGNFSDDYYSYFYNLEKIEYKKNVYRMIEEIPPEVEFQKKLLFDNGSEKGKIFFVNPYETQQLPETLIDRTALHSWKLEFIHPVTKENLEITAPIPEDFEKVIDAFA